MIGFVEGPQPKRSFSRFYSPSFCLGFSSSKEYLQMNYIVGWSRKHHRLNNFVQTLELAKHFFLLKKIINIEKA